MVKHFLLLSIVSIVFFACSDNTNRQSTAVNDAAQISQFGKDKINKVVALQCIRAYAAKGIQLI